MRSRIVTLVLVVGIAFSAVALAARLRGARLPGNQQGYEPEQPIAFSHRLHAGELGISCLYCHSGAESSKHAGIPASSVCMNCHNSVTAPRGATLAEEETAKKEGRKPRPIVSDDLRKLYAAFALDDNLKPVPGKKPQSIPWVKVHNLPDFACFDHRAHINAGVACQRCHGPVETMERVRQVESLSMGWCVSCHREANSRGIDGKKAKASLDCAACHY
ncbi:MAG: hypothetical protein L0Z62_13600 [Gemmataceae bacterium]|nr:hypothetical protein [Gemmataceae bacterium]